VAKRAGGSAAAVQPQRGTPHAPSSTSSAPMSAALANCGASAKTAATRCAIGGRLAAYSDAHPAPQRTRQDPRRAGSLQQHRTEARERARRPQGEREGLFGKVEQRHCAGDEERDGRQPKRPSGEPMIGRARVHRRRLPRTARPHACRRVRGGEKERFHRAASLAHGARRTRRKSSRKIPRIDAGAEKAGTSRRGPPAQNAPSFAQ
jgi:hypothetical protein